MNSELSDRETAETNGYMAEILWNQAYEIYKELEEDYGQTKSNNLFRDNQISSLNSKDPNYGNLDILLDFLSPHSRIYDSQDYANPSEEYLRNFVRIMEANNVDSYEDFRETVLQIGEFKAEKEQHLDNFVKGEFLKNLWELEFDITTD
jgi:hypothetical protein